MQNQYSYNFLMKFSKATTKIELMNITKKYISIIIKENRQFYKTKQKHYVELAIKYVENNLSRNISIQTVSKYVDLSPSYFQTIFKKNSGLSFKEYVTRRKIKESLLLLQKGNKSIKKIAYLLGYNAPSYFTSVFGKTLKQTPSEYIKKIQMK